ncbi:MAG: ATP-binding cassette domain-containing protein [Chloroflexi bacterium]|nr:ATP-binding cassette domain-containing protein [Chloroflexota bacterium]MYE41096.1 ATP-binding cassette domain-containing protein [Chloroflexota bacterium]
MSNHSSSSHAIDAEGIVRNFGAVRAVDGVDLAVRKGEIYGFLGPNGAGKTTVIRMLVTLLAPTSGRMMVAGYDVMRDADQVRSRIGVALQEAALDNKQTGRELLRLQGQLYGLGRREVARRIEELSGLVDIGDAMGRLIGTYSGGMKRRLDLAAALIHYPDVLFLDEPTTGLDPLSRSRIWEEVRDINSKLGVTIFLTTQYLEEADALAERVGIIDQGRLVAEGSPGELKQGRGSDLIVVRLDGDAETAIEALAGIPSVSSVEAHGSEITIAVSNGAALISAVALRLNESGLTVEELTLRTPTLDDVFLQVTGTRFQSDPSSQVSSEEEATQHVTA